MRLIVKYKDQSQAVFTIQNRLGAIVLFLEKTTNSRGKEHEQTKSAMSKIYLPTCKRNTQILNACKMITC
jgi:hypothetical protein